MKIVLLAFILLYSLILKSQNSIIDKLEEQNNNYGKVIIYSSINIKNIIEKHINVNQKAKGFPGYRIQVYFDSGNKAKNQANKIKTEILEKFPDVNVYIVYEEPFFKVRVGDYRTKLEAYSFFKILSTLYPSSFIVEDLISFPKL